MESKLNLSFFYRLSGKFAIGFCILAVIISTGTCSMGYFLYKNSVEKLYNDTAYEIARQAVSMVDGDDIKRYADNNSIDDKYYEMKAEIENLREKMNVVAIFIVQVNSPKDGYYKYILDTIPDEELLHEFGDIEEYSERNREFVEGCYYQGLEFPDKYIYFRSQKYGKNSFALSPIYDENGDISAILIVQSSVELIQKTLDRFLFFSVIFTVVLVALFLTVYLAYLRHTLIKPINSIAVHTSEFIEHYTDEMPSALSEVMTGDEIGILSRSIIKMESDIRDYVDNLKDATAAREHMAAEFKIAGKIREDLFPCTFPAFPERRDFDIYVKLSGCKAIGGNFYNFFLINNGKMFVLLGDVSGNGVPAAMFSVVACTLISNCGTEGLSPARILEEAGNRLSKNNNSHRTVNAFLGVINLNTGHMSYSTAGNMDAFIKRSGEELSELALKKSIPLATIDQAVYSNQEIYLSQGELLCIMTTGCALTMDNKGDILGKDCVRGKLNEIIMQEYSLENMAELFFDYMDVFGNGKERESDASMLLFRYNTGL